MSDAESAVVTIEVKLNMPLVTPDISRHCQATCSSDEHDSSRQVLHIRALLNSEIFSLKISKHFNMLFS